MSGEPGIAAGTLGAILNALGLRRERKPNERALVEGYAQTRFNGSGVSVDWHINKVVELVRSSTEYAALRPSQETQRATRKRQREPLRSDMYTASALLDRGWTRLQIRAHPPDLVIPPDKNNPLAGPIRQRFWKQSRIKLIEAQRKWELRRAALNLGGHLKCRFCLTPEEPLTVAEHGREAAASAKPLGKI